MDMVDRAKVDAMKEELASVFHDLDPDTRLALCRDIISDRIEKEIKKLPVESQKELLALLTHKLMTEWKA